MLRTGAFILKPDLRARCRRQRAAVAQPYRPRMKWLKEGTSIAQSASRRGPEASDPKRKERHRRKLER